MQDVMAVAPGVSRRWFGHALLWVLWLTPAATQAQPLSEYSPLGLPVASPSQDDATLHDVQFAGARIGIAVGDRGVVWRTEDGGQTWQFRPTGIDASLRGVCLLSERHGWAVGQLVTPGSRLRIGCVLATEDGGLTWRRLDDGRLPPLSDVQFFDAQHGCVVGGATVDVATGLLVTEDGGRTWFQAPGSAADEWSSAAFFNPRNGVLAGPRSQQGVFGNGRLLPLRSTRSLPAWHDVAVTSEGHGWMAGDGGNLRVTTDFGVSWSPPAEELPREVRSAQDLYAIAMHDRQVWTTGSPGSVVWHSADGGSTWQAQRTSDPAPIRALHFPTPQLGCAVGAFGSIRLTQDGGRTWRTVRGGARRPALLAVLADAKSPPLPLIVRESGESGYRSVGLLMTRRDFGPDQSAHLAADEHLRAMLLAAGGNDLDRQWRLPLSTPGLELDAARLIASWERLHEQRLREVFLGGLVAMLRTWRPEVIVCDEPTAGDAVMQLVRDVLPRAIEQAADPTWFPEHRSMLGLEPWDVPKVFVRTLSAEGGAVMIDPHQVLPRLGTTVHQATRRAELLASSPLARLINRESYRLEWTSPNLSVARGTEAANNLARGIFTGLAIPAGGPARRAQPPLTDVNDEQLSSLARLQRNFAAYTERMLDDPLRAGQIIGQVRQTTAPLPPAEAARLLADLADSYRRRSQWEHVEDTLVELVDCYPEEPVAREALQWLLSRWGSQEVLWQRVRALNASSPQRILDPQVQQANFEQAVAAVQQAENVAQAEHQAASLPSPWKSTDARGAVRVGGLQSVLDNAQFNLGQSPVNAGHSQVQFEITRRWQQARRASDLLQQIDPALHARPEIQFPLAALHRAQQKNDIAAETYRRFFGLEDGATPWNLIARGELWIASQGALSPRPVLRCARVTTPPLLDGLLTDPCWQSAPEARLTDELPDAASIDTTFVGDRRIDQLNAVAPRPVDAGPAPIIMLGYDERFLYLAASVPRHSDAPLDRPQYAGRVHDDNLQTFDRLVFAFDIDRDYATWYQFEVDQRGSTREAVWEDQRWNPTWYVAVDADSQHWRIEAAIPFEHLAATPPTRGAVWAAGLTRVIPMTGVQSWTLPPVTHPRPEQFGLIQFD